ncbi:MAG: tRNA (adenosine(37)-N6)-threonylcarbamoyltransferase complex transferase subunit TsaD [Desulfobacteraceae bacterium]
MNVLGIETSCDETAAAVVRNGKEILSSVVSSQVDVHHKYGGVVPELASRMHIESILPVVSEALLKAGISREHIDGVAATRGPGLIGALLVGFSFAKAFAWARNIPMAGVNHLEGHIYSVLLNKPSPDFPFIALLVSGGHTNLYRVVSLNDFQLLGQTRDDAAGEAFDKVSKMLGLGYPGGAVIEKLAEKGDPSALDFPRSYLDKDSFDFSFSGLKSSVARYIHENRDLKEKETADIAAGFQAAVFDVLSRKLITAAEKKQCSSIAVAGGVAANSALTQRLSEDASRHGLEFFKPEKAMCGDNAAMIAARGYQLIRDNCLVSLKHDVFSRNRIDMNLV